MPNYEFECTNPDCACKFIVYYGWRVADGVNVLDDPGMQDCPKCDSHADQLFSLTVMRPDTFWNGIYMNAVGKYFDSESKYKAYLKENQFEIIGDRTDRESHTKEVRQANKEKDARHAKELDNFLIEETKHEEWGATGTVKERRKKEQKRLEMESAHPEDVAIDPAFL